MRLYYSLRRRYVRWYRRGKRQRRIAWALGGTLSILLFYGIFFSAPLSFPEGTLITIEEGSSVREAGEKLKQTGLIRSRMLFETTVRLQGGSNIAGQYSFQRRENIFTVAGRLASGDFKLNPTRVRILEGATARDIAKQLGEELEDFNEEEFLKLALPKEGYLFPSTYFIYPGATPETVVRLLETTFEEKISSPSVKAAIERSGKTVEEIVIMASLLEKEAPHTYDRRVIAGVLWERIDRGMLLQVDAIFPYIIGKNSFNLTRADLAIDHPYNSYVHKGLPPGAIANPSLDAILAAATPIASNYLFYLSDMSGNIHYSATYEQHLAAKRKYLDS